jgi:hypothetical protein
LAAAVLPFEATVVLPEEVFGVVELAVVVECEGAGR